jgi:hypothetical protein
MVSDSVFGTRAEAPASAACSPSGWTRGADSPARPDDDGEPDSSGARRGRAHDDDARALSPPASRAAVDDVDARLASFTRRVDATLRAMDAFDARLAETQREGTPVKARGDRARVDDESPPSTTIANANSERRPRPDVAPTARRGRPAMP